MAAFGQKQRQGVYLDHSGPERREGPLYMIRVGDKYGWVREEVVLEMDAE